MYKSKVIVKVGVELGSIALHGMQAERDWKFWREVNDQTPDLLDEEPIHTKSATVDTWAAALELLDKYPWATFYPVFVDPDFKQEILDAVKERLKDDSETSQSESLKRWRAVCGRGDYSKMLAQNRAAGSRMHVLDWLDGGLFIPSINEMILRPTEFFVPQSGKRMPKGWHDTNEALLGKRCGSLIDDDLNATILTWWLVNVRGANVPNWDLACEALYHGNRPALVPGGEKG